MKRIILLSVSVFALLLPLMLGRMTNIGIAQNSNPERTIIRMEQDIATALSMNDPDELQAFLADDFVVWMDDGSSYTKSQILSDLRSKTNIFSSYDNFNLKVKVFGDTAVVMGQNIYRVTNRGQQSESRASFTRIYAKRQGNWQAVVLRWGCRF